MAPSIVPVQTDSLLPAETRVVIIGGGIIGASTALFLSLRGIPCVLVEKGRIAGEQSSRNWGWVRKMGRDPRELPLMIESERIWEQLDALTESDTGYTRSGIAYLCQSEADVRKRREWLDMASEFRLDSAFVSGKALNRIFPGMAASSIAALHTASDGRAEPQQAVPAIVRGARARGAKVFADCAARTIERAAGKVSSVITERGEIKCDAVVLAGGAWTSLFCANMGLRLPQLNVQATVARTMPMEGGPTTAALGSDFSFRKRRDGGYTITKGLTVRAEIVPDSFRYFPDFLPLLKAEWGSFSLGVGQRSWTELTRARHWSPSTPSPFEASRTLDPQPAGPADKMISDSLVALFPFFAKARVAEHWSGLIDATPDVVPVISKVAGWPGFVVATGFSGHGFGIGPGAGKLIADLVSDEKPVVDPYPFRFDRFSDGSRPRPLTGI